MANYPFKAPWHKVFALSVMILFSAKITSWTVFHFFRKGAFFIKKVIFLSIFIVAVCQKEIKTTGEHFFREPWQAVGFLWDTLRSQIPSMKNSMLIPSIKSTVQKKIQTLKFLVLKLYRNKGKMHICYFTNMWQPLAF